jgi:tRNA (guanosine-2'-O-)-methyltransferase
MHPERLGGLCLLMAIAACERRPASTVLEPAHVVSPAGVSFIEACTPTGPEICANATDDNCNGLIDEGCGVGTGKLQFEVAWGDSPAVIELIVVDPRGDRVDSAHRSTPSGLKLDRICPQDGCHGMNVDNVSFVGERPISGQYTVTVKLTDTTSASLPVKARFGWRIGTRGATTEILLYGVDDTKVFSFEL